MPIPYVIDFNGLTMNTTLSNDKLGGNVMEEVKNAEILMVGDFRKRKGLAEPATGGTLNPTTASAEVTAIAQQHPKTGFTVYDVAAVVRENIWVLLARSSGWSDLGDPGFTGSYAAFNNNIAWGVDTSDRSVVYFCLNTGTVAVAASASATEMMGSIGDASNPWTTCKCAEYHLNKLWVANTVESASNKDARIRWSVTGDHNDFYSSGSGFLDLSAPGLVGSSGEGIQAMRVYKNRLYVLSALGLYEITGTTSATFGSRFIRPQKFGVGTTMFVVQEWLFYVDHDGIWQFDGARAQNLITDSMQSRWNDLGDNSDVDQATASWSIQESSYYVFFPNVQEEWCYNYRTGQWSINEYNATDEIHVISPPIVIRDEPGIRLTGAKTNNKILQTGKDATADDGNAITASFKTGHIRLGEVGGNPGDRFRIEAIEVETVQQDEAGVVKIQLTIDGTAGTQETLTVGDAGASADTFPTSYDGQDGNTMIDLTDANLTGKYLQMEVTDDDANSRCDIRRIVIWYEPLAWRTR